MTQRQHSKRNYSDRTLKILWGRAVGRCAVPSCRIELFADSTDYDPIVVIGDIAHIEAASDNGPRANQRTATKERDEYDNLILLCKNCHARLDGQKNSNTVEYIRQLRNNHEAWVRTNLPERGHSRIGWKGVVLQGTHPVDTESLHLALLPDYLIETPEVITILAETSSWEMRYAVLQEQVAGLLTSNDPFVQRYAVFPLAPVSACLALGYLLTNRPHVRLFQYHRSETAWKWLEPNASVSKVAVMGLPTKPTKKTTDIAICFHVSTTITARAVADTRIRFGQIIHVSVSCPGTGWLQSESQLKELENVIRELFETCVNLFPNCRKWHLFCAVPAPVAVLIGQQLNPTMTPLVQLYEFMQSTQPAYQPSFILGAT